MQTLLLITSRVPVTQILSIAAVGLGLAVSAAWAALLGFELFRMIGLMF